MIRIPAICVSSQVKSSQRFIHSIYIFNGNMRNMEYIHSILGWNNIFLTEVAIPPAAVRVKIIYPAAG